MKTYAIGDVHGCLHPLQKALEWIYTDSDGDPTEVVFLGDYVDRGKHSKEVVDLLIKGPEEDNIKFVFLRGNHEQMLLRALKYPGERQVFFMNGGKKTLKSYNLLPYMMHMMPQEHVDFYNSTKLWHETENYIFVHAGLHPGFSLEEHKNFDEPDEVFLWIRDEFLNSSYDWGKKVVHGHTPLKTEVPHVRPNRINLDTGMVFGGKLTVGVLHEPEFRFQQFDFLS